MFWIPNNQNIWAFEGHEISSSNISANPQIRQQAHTWCTYSNYLGS
jgi:hypothetical protein